MPARTRRLSDKIHIAFESACLQGDHEVATRLLQVMERLLARKPATAGANRRRLMEDLISGYERVWAVRQSAAGAVRDSFTNPDDRPAPTP